MTNIKLLVEGYVRKENKEFFASSAVTLIQENGINIIVDPGTDRAKLIKALEDANLKISDIHYVILTHHHLDHSLLAGIFENAKVLDCGKIHQWDGRMKPHQSVVPGTSVEIIHTPGHDALHGVILADTEEYGMVGICGDVFWWMEGKEQRTDRESLLKHKDPFASNKELLNESRIKILDLCDYIIPGHGKMFKVEK